MFHVIVVGINRIIDSSMLMFSECCVYQTIYSSFMFSIYFRLMFESIVECLCLSNVVFIKLLVVECLYLSNVLFIEVSIVIDVSIYRTIAS